MVTALVRTAHDVGAQALVHRSEVHKHRDESVWIGAIEEAGDSISARYTLPPFGATPRLTELMEVQRQAGTVHVHRHFDVPSSHIFVLNSIDLALSPGSVLSASDRHGFVSVQPELASRPARRHSAAQRFELITGSGRVGVGSSSASFVPRNTYERLRRLSPRSTRISGSELGHGAWVLELATSPGDPLLADHGSDHVPAMSIISGVENAIARRFRGAALRAVSTRFLTYAEHSAALLLSGESGSEGHFAGTVTQDGVVCAVVEGTTTAIRDE